MQDGESDQQLEVISVVKYFSLLYKKKRRDINIGKGGRFFLACCVNCCFKPLRAI